jgi:hypothetical protein
MRIRYRPTAVAALFATAALAAAVTPAAAALADAGVAGRAAVAPVAARAAVQAVGLASSVPGGTQRWVDRFQDGANRSAVATAVAASPNGPAVYVTGLTTASPKPMRHQVTVAYNAATGAQLWTASYPGVLGHHAAGNSAVTVSPNGRMVFVASGTANGSFFSNSVVLAYNAATGAQLWAGGGSSRTFAALPRPMVVSPDSSTVYLTGRMDDHYHKSYVTMALNAATGDVLWSQTATFRPHVGHGLTSIAVSPDGSAVFIGGSSATIAYAAATGKQLWIDAYKLTFGRYQVFLAVSPDSTTLYATGAGLAKGSAAHFWTVALSAATGAQLWRATYQGATSSDNSGADAIALSPDGSAVYVTGMATAGEYTTIAYAAATGARLWLAQSPIAGGGFATPASVAISPDGSKLAITGSSGQASGYSTAVLDAATGARLWLATYQDPGGAPTQAAGVVFSHSGAQVVVTGSSVPASGPSEFATVAYQS